MNNKNVVYIPYQMLFSCKKKSEITKSAGKWMDLEKIMLREVTQTQKRQTFSLLSY